MKSSQQEIIINHASDDLYNIVLDIEKYPEFLPWCKKINIISKSKNEIMADMVVKYNLLFPQKFSSHVFFDKNKLLIKTKYVDGPLKDLNTKWNFKKIEKEKTKVIFNVEFEFKKLLHQKLAELFYHLIEDRMIVSFKERADKILD